MSYKRRCNSLSVGVGIGVSVEGEGAGGLEMKLKSNLKSGRKMDQLRNLALKIVQTENIPDFPRRKDIPVPVPVPVPVSVPVPVPVPVIQNCCNDLVDVPSPRPGSSVTKTSARDPEGKLLGWPWPLSLYCTPASSISSSSCTSAAGRKNSSVDGMAIRLCNCQGSRSRNRNRWSRRRVKSKSLSSLFPQDLDYLNRIVLVSLLLLSSFTLLPGVVTGLKCYECLSLQCDSKLICESIKDSITRTFVPNSHYIHFDPRILCPEPHVPTNSSQWDAVSLNCSRSDSLCLEAPVEVITSFDGFREGKKLERNSQMTSLGFLRGCANRRGLNELEVTISVRKIYMTNDTWEQFTLSHGRSSSSNNNNNNNHISKIHHNNNNRFEPDNYNSNSNIARSRSHGYDERQHEHKEQSRTHDNVKYNDGYKISRVHYHEIYVDHGTSNATRCYMDDCNNRKKLRIRSNGVPLSPRLFRSSFIFNCYFLTFMMLLLTSLC